MPTTSVIKILVVVYQGVFLTSGLVTSVINVLQDFTDRTVTLVLNIVKIINAEQLMERALMDVKMHNSLVISVTNVRLEDMDRTVRKRVQKIAKMIYAIGRMAHARMAVRQTLMEVNVKNAWLVGMEKCVIKHARTVIKVNVTGSVVYVTVVVMDYMVSIVMSRVLVDVGASSVIDTMRHVHVVAGLVIQGTNVA